jgi:protein-L-isoaspartate(D-aspartate) O-methyltransferase
MSEMNIEQARFNMIEQQIRPWEVLDQKVLNIIADVPREEFVPATYMNLAFTDMCVPIGYNEVMMAPKLEARMLQSLDIQPQESVLEVGTGTGYVTTLLAKLARHVYSIDIHEEFVAAARGKLASDGTVNVTIEQGDAAQGWERHAPYNVIALTGSVPLLPKAFQESLAIGGRLFAIVGDAPVMEARLITRVGQNEYQEQNLFETDLPPLRNALQPNRFVL